MPQYYEIDVKFSVADYGAVTRRAVDELTGAIRIKSRENLNNHRLGRWSKGLKVSSRMASDRGYEITVRLNPGFLRVFEEGGVATGKPFLWIPLSAFGSGVKVKARNYGRPLFRPRGKNVLVSSDRRVRYIGVRQVRFSPRLSLRQIAEDEAARFIETIEASGNG